MKKQKNIPKIIAIVGIVLAIAAFIASIPIYVFFENYYRITEMLEIFCGELVYEYHLLLISLILPGALLLLNKQHSKKIAVAFTVISVVVLLGQLLGNVSNLIFSFSILVLGIDYNPFSEAAIGSHFLSGIVDLIRSFSLSSKYIIPCILVSVGNIVSSLLFFVKNVLCLVGFGMIAFKKEKLEKLEQ